MAVNLQTTPRIEDNVLEATRTMLETELLPAIQNETTSRMDQLENLVTNMQSQLTSNDEEIKNLKDKVNTLEANQDTSKVIFSGVRKNHISSHSDFTYDEIIVNVGQGLDAETGIFKCPVSGIYSFSFGAVTDMSDTYTFVKVIKNGVTQFLIHENDNGHKSSVNLSHVWTMVLQKDDMVKLRLGNGKGLFSDSHFPVLFNVSFV